MPRWVPFELLFFTTSAYALWRGGAPERIAATTFILAATLSPFVRRPFGVQFASLEFGVLLVDATVLLVMFMIALSSERFWPIWMTAMAGITVLIHLSTLLQLYLKPWAYWRAEALWSYPMQLLLAVATLRHQHRLKIMGADRSWKRSFAR